MMTIHLNLNEYALAPKCQVDNLLCGWDFNVVMLTYYLYFAG